MSHTNNASVIVNTPTYVLGSDGCSIHTGSENTSCDLSMMQIIMQGLQSLFMPGGIKTSVITPCVDIHNHTIANNFSMQTKKPSNKIKTKTSSSVGAASGGITSQVPFQQNNINVKKI